MSKIEDIIFIYFLFIYYSCPKAKQTIACKKYKKNNVFTVHSNILHACLK